MKQFLVKDEKGLRKNGFEDWGDGKRLIYGSNRAICIFMIDGHLTFQNLTKESVALLCQLYKDGIIDIVDDDVKKTHTMKVTDREMKLLLARRKKAERK